MNLDLLSRSINLCPADHHRRQEISQLSKKTNSERKHTTADLRGCKGGKTRGISTSLSKNIPKTCLGDTVSVEAHDGDDPGVGYSRLTPWKRISLNYNNHAASPALREREQGPKGEVGSIHPYYVSPGSYTAQRASYHLRNLENFSLSRYRDK